MILGIGLYPTSKLDIAEDLDTRLALCIQVLSVKGTAHVWSCVC